MPKKPCDAAFKLFYQYLGSHCNRDCTLTVCAQDGRVVGCVDLLGRQGLSRNSRKLKRSLLTQCGIAYLVIEPGSILGTAQIRTVLLGEAAALNYASESERDEAKIATARLKLSEVLERQRRIRNGYPKSANAHPPRRCRQPVFRRKWLWCFERV